MTPVLTPEYDYMGRRIRKMVRDGGQVVLTDEKFCYDGWNLLAVINAANNNSTKTFLWGLDLSGSQQGAGGVGGLLSIWQTGDGSHFACYDGNGNVMKLMSATTVTETANYEYSPFGDVVLASGTAATANPFRFSTKYTDDETGLFYYGYRYYIPGTGRWASRDPMGERGGRNVYAFVANRPINLADFLGFCPCKLGDRTNATCEPKILHYATIPGYEEATDKLFEIVKNTDAYTDILEIVLNGGNGGVSAVIEAVTAWLADNNINEYNAQEVYDLARKAAESGHGAWGGFKLWSRVHYEECVPGFLGLWNKWQEKTTDWKQFMKRTNHNNDQFIYEIKGYAAKDGDEACDAHLEEFNK